MSVCARKINAVTQLQVSLQQLPLTTLRFKQLNLSVCTLACLAGLVNEAITRNQLTEQIVNSSIMVSRDYWKRTCKLFADQQFKNGLFLQASTYYVMCDEVCCCCCCYCSVMSRLSYTRQIFLGCFEVTKCYHKKFPVGH